MRMILYKFEYLQQSKISPPPPSARLSMAKIKKMVNSVTVKNKEGELVCLKINEAHIEIEHKSTDTKELVSFCSIYGVQYKHDAHEIVIHLSTSFDPNILSETSSNPDLNNLRPKQVQWVQRMLTYTATDDSLAPMADELRKQSLPHQSVLASTPVFVILNPTSGQQLAEKHFKDTVKPMLLTAGFQTIEKILTESNGRTRGIAESLGKRLSSYTTPPIIVAMGGDGTLHEIINGLADAESDRTNTHFRLGVIPAGSGNAFALGLGIESIEQATLKIIHSTEEKPFYLMNVQFGHATKDKEWSQHIVYDEMDKPIRLLVVMSWGFHAQIVSKSRYLRYFMGNQRFSLVAMFLLKFLQQYEGELVLKQVKKYDATNEAWPDSAEEEVILGTDKRFTYFIASKQHSLEKGFQIAPHASCLSNDLDVVALREVDAETLTNASIAAFQGGKHITSPQVDYFKANELLLRVPYKTELCLDGEIYSLPAKGIVNLKVIESSTDRCQFTVFV
ncbi:ATP-NAD kinase-like domain-containing protein [Blakeslea trispora]|nr:ATP-NAD kinase-like domain-containing protein [Blakeslea trispora]